jgi:hypothetical protein
MRTAVKSISHLLYSYYPFDWKIIKLPEASFKEENISDPVRSSLANYLSSSRPSPPDRALVFQPSIATSIKVCIRRNHYRIGEHHPGLSLLSE